jgi:catechol-2,3-dioxygenase
MDQSDEPRRWDRRALLGAAAAWSFLGATHASGLGLGNAARREPTQAATAPRRIAALRLLTATPLEALADFYGGTLGLRVEESGVDRLTVAVGLTKLTFVPAPPEQRGAFYHVAFNVPENKLRLARDWQLERTTLLPPRANQVDPSYPEDVTWFRNWNAHSVFFWDPAGNLLEHIARHDLATAAPGRFGSQDILYASEIALITGEVPRVAAAVASALGLATYREPSEVFQALGDERGLVLVIERGRDWWGKPTAVHPVEVELEAERPASFDGKPAGLPYRITVSAS